MMRLAFTRRVVSSAIAAGLALGLAPSTFAMTWGQPRVVSAPDKPMRVVIRLDDVKVSEQIGMRATVAPKEITGLAAADISPALNGAVIRLDPLDRNAVEMTINGAAPLREPFLMFYVMVSWENGQTLIPVSVANPAAPPAPPPPPPALAPAAAPAPQPMPEPPAAVVVVPPPAPVATEPAQAQAPAAPTPPPAPSAPPAPAVQGKKGGSKPAPAAMAANGKTIEVQRGDTASQLVQPYADNTVNLNQMLIALLNKNPDAFVEGNVNRLKAGATLTMPDVEEARQIGKAQATQQVQVQVEAFETYKAGVSKKLGKVNQDAAKSSASGDLVKQNDPKEAPKDKLKLNQADQAAADQKAAQQKKAQDEKSLTEAKKNLDELNKLADQVSKGPGTGTADAPSSQDSGTATPSAAPAATDGVTGPASKDNETLLDTLSKEPSLYYLGAGVILVLLAFAARARSRANLAKVSKANSANEPAPSPRGLGLPPEFNLELAPPAGASPASGADSANAMPDAPAFDHRVAAFASDEPPSGFPSHAGELSAPSLPASSLDHPSDSLSIGNDEEENPHIVRLKLADELWQLGQFHTSRALAQEVLEQGDEMAKEAAHHWLQVHS